jgi:hypothetical protein
MDGEMDSYIERQMDNRISFEFVNLGGLEMPQRDSIRIFLGFGFLSSNNFSWRTRHS